MTVIQEIADERQRQIDGESWTAEHDNCFRKGELLLAAAAYILNRANKQEIANNIWPWDQLWWRPKNHRRDLVRAAALIVAELDRFDREA